MVLNIQGNQTEPETTIGRFGLEEKDPTVGIDLPKGLINDYFKTVQSSPDGLYPELPTETSTTEPITEPSTTSQTEKLFGKRPKLRPPKPTIRPKRRPGSVSPIDKILELNYLLEGRRDLKSKKSQVLSGLNSLTESGRKAIKGFFDNAAGGESNLDPTKDYWCAAFVAHVLSELGADPLKSKDRYDRLRADKYRDYGSKIESFEDAKEGDIVVWDIDKDGKGDHVTFYAGDRITSQGDKDPYTGEEYINVVGGNHDMGEVSLRENHPMYTKDRVLAIRRITYNDIDFNFTEQMAKQDPVFKKFIPDYASLDTDPADFVDDDLPSFDEGGLAENKDLDLARSYGVTVVDPEETSQTVKALGKAAIESIPGVSTAATIRDIKEELKEEDPSLAKIGMLAASEAVGLVPGLGQVGKTIIRKTSTKVVDKAADAKEAERLIKDSEALEQWRKENKLPESQRQKNPEGSKKAASDLLEGEITSKEARQRIKDFIPDPQEFTAEQVLDMMPSLTQITGALGKKAKKYPIIGVKGKDLDKGQVVSSRLDINAYDDYDTWVVSIHDGNQKSGSVVGYGQAIRLKNINFGSDPKAALDIARGKRLVQATGEDAPKPQGKATIARIFGEYQPEDPYDLQRQAAEIIASGSEEWTQIGMNPYRGSAFYNKKTGAPVFEADEIIQVGPLVLAKNVKKPTISQMKQMAVRTRDGKLRMFNEGGTAMKDQMQMAFKDDGMTKDPVSGNEVPPGSLAKEVRDDIPAMLSEGEYVVPADVLRYYGVNFFENLRNQAKSGLQTMEATGRIGGEPLSPSQVQQNMSGQRMAGAPPVQPVAANTGPAMLGQQSQTGANTATTGQPVQNQFTPMNFSTVGFSQFQQPNQKPVSVTNTKTYVNSKNTSDTRIVTYVDGAVTPPADLKYTQPPYYLMGSPALAEAIKGAPQGGGGGGGGGTPDVDPPDPNEWIKQITDSESAIAWAKKNLEGDAKNLLDIFKLGTSVSRTRALAISAEARNDPETAKILNDLASATVKKHTALQFVPEGALNGTSNNAKAEKVDEYKSLLDKIFGIKKEIVPSQQGDPKKPVVTTEDDSGSGGDGGGGGSSSSTPSGVSGDDPYEDDDDDPPAPPPGYSSSGTSTATQTIQDSIDAQKDLDARSQDPTAPGGPGVNKGGLMQRKKKKGK